MTQVTYEHKCEPMDGTRPGPHPGISQVVTRWTCPDCGSKWEVKWHLSGTFGEPAGGEGKRLSGPSRRWQREARRAVAAAATAGGIQ